MCVFTLLLTHLSLETGCDSGFGHSLALSLNESGIHVFAGCLFPEKEGGRSLMIKASHPKKMHVIAIDVSNDLTVKMAHEEVTHKLSQLPDVKLHAVVNNAGICPYGEIEWGTFDMIKHVLEVNTFGAVLVTRTFLPLIRENQGRIVNVNSVAARFAVPGMIPYCMSKYASLAFTEGLRREVSKFGVKVISIEPYFFDTKMTDEEAIRLEVEKLWKASSSEVRESYGEHYMKRMSKQTKLIRPFVNKSLDPVIQALRHAVTATRPRYHYVCANLPTRIMIYIGMFMWPQETIESITNWFLLTVKRAEPLPNRKAIQTNGSNNHSLASD